MIKTSDNTEIAKISGINSSGLLKLKYTLISIDYTITTPASFSLSTWYFFFVSCNEVYESGVTKCDFITIDGASQNDFSAIISDNMLFH